MKTFKSRTSTKSVSPLVSEATTSLPSMPANVMGMRTANARPDVSHFDQLPDAALIAVKAVAVVVGKGISSIWRDIKNDADFPKPIRLSAGCTRFRVGDLRAYLAKKAMVAPQPQRNRVQKAE